MNEDEKIRPHEADGIKEFDNPMPSWWVKLFWLTIVYAVGYMFYIHLGPGSTIKEELLAEKKALKAAEEKFLAENKASMAGEESGKAPLSAQEILEKGQKTYMTYCMPCHGDKGQGTVGPNLTDEYWLHGGSRQDIIKSIAKGIPTKGMAPWLSVLGSVKIDHVTTYIESLKGTNPKNPKAPQGKKYVP